MNTNSNRASTARRHSKLSPAEDRSVWWMTGEVPHQPPLTSDMAADVCVVGAGIAGLTTAYLLARDGASVVVVDDGPIGRGMTGQTTAHLSTALDDRYVELERLHGQTGSRLAAESHAAAIDRIEAIVEEEGIECDFERLDGYLFVPPGESTKILDDELEAARRAGLRDVAKVERAPLERFDTGPALRFPRQAQFHVVHYLAGLAKALTKAGGHVFCGSHASAVAGGSSARVEIATGAAVSCAHVVVATNTPINDRFAIHTKQAPYISYVVGGLLPAGTVARALYWDTPDPYHYVRLQSFDDATDVLLIGGEDHKTGHQDEPEMRFAALETWARERFPALGTFDFRWSGQVLEPVDGLAFIGRNPGDDENVLIATGDSGHGLTHGTIAGILLRDLVRGRENPWATLYDPSRKSLRAVKEFAKENLDVAAQYTDWGTSGDVASSDEIPRANGAIMRRGLSKVAVYRDEAGALHERSAVCPHLGCIVRWNSDGKSWDCPCHGSRFDPLGRVIIGPANSDLAAVDESDG